MGNRFIIGLFETLGWLLPEVVECRGAMWPYHSLEGLLDDSGRDPGVMASCAILPGG